MHCTALEPLYRLAAQSLTPPDWRWLEAWPQLLGNIQLDLWLNREDEALIGPLSAVMQNLPNRAEPAWLMHVAEDYAALFALHLPDTAVPAAVQQAAERWGYSSGHAGEPGLAPAFGFLAYLCRTAIQQPQADVTRRQLLAGPLGPVVQATAYRLQRQATTGFYESVGAFLPALISCDLAGSVQITATIAHFQTTFRQL